MRRAHVRWPLGLVGMVVVAAVDAVAPRVAANAPAGRYTIPGDGTVYDTMTQLTWQQAVPAQSLGSSAAMTYCSQNMANLPGGPWRLPNIKELQTLVDESQVNGPMVDPTAFPGVNGTPGWGFLSSSPVVGLSGFVWCVDFGLYGGDASTCGSTPAIRCVH
jgi:hypothetical protein